MPFTSSRVINFGAGPSTLPESVLHEAAQGLLNFKNTGIGIAEISHRSQEFTAYIAEVEGLIRGQLDVPETHSILFTQGGGAAQFSAIVLNLLARHRLLYPNLPANERILDYVVTGYFSRLAIEEAYRLGGGRVNVVVDSRTHSQDGKFDNIPAHNAFRFSVGGPDPALIFYCDNETIDGVQFSDDPASPASFPFYLLPKNALLPLVGDYSSSFMSRPIPRLADHAVIFAGAQKSVGPAGLTILIVRKDCLVDVDAAAALGAAPVPLTMAYKTLSDNSSVYNTAPVLSIYIAGLVLRRSQDLGGIKYYEEVNKRKAKKLYSVIREGEAKGVFKAKVKEDAGSLMTVTFDVVGDGAEDSFISGAEARGMKGIKGHPSVGGNCFFTLSFRCAFDLPGLRVSLYNAITEDQTDALVAYMKDFLATRVL
ncbi:pyridoxal phosphate-dependent transferase [Mycena filopes]|nr:pyridoxal phosphate-dependent transferase [Mycena filopes]